MHEPSASMTVASLRKICAQSDTTRCRLKIPLRKGVSVLQENLKRRYSLEIQRILRPCRTVLMRG